MKQSKPLKRLSIVGEYQVRTKKLLSPASKERNYVYFVEAISTDRIKIGTSCKPASRLDAMKTDCPFPIKALLMVQIPWQYEQALHEIFAEYRLCGEWFEACDEILAFIDECLSLSDVEVFDLLNERYEDIIDKHCGSGTTRFGDNPRGRYTSESGRLNKKSHWQELLEKSEKPGKIRR